MIAAAEGHCDCNSVAQRRSIAAVVASLEDEVAMDKRVLFAAAGLSAGMFACGSSGSPKAAVPPEVERTSTVSMSTPPAAPSPTEAPAVRPSTPPPLAEQAPASGAENVAQTNVRARIEGRDVTADDVDALVAAVSDGARRSARLASTRARDPRVQRFATEALGGSRSEARAKTTGERSASESPIDTTASMRLRTTTDQSMRALEKQQGRTFDRAYMTFQVALRRDALDALDHDLGPRIRDAAVEARWAEAKARLRAECDEAETLVDAIAPRAPEAP